MMEKGGRAAFSLMVAMGQIMATVMHNGVTFLSMFQPKSATFLEPKLNSCDLKAILKPEVAHCADPLSVSIYLAFLPIRGLLF